jgi:hypothetical protein
MLTKVQQNLDSHEHRPYFNSPLIVFTLLVFFCGSFLFLFLFFGSK